MDPQSHIDAVAGAISVIESTVANLRTFGNSGTSVSAPDHAAKVAAKDAAASPRVASLLQGLRSLSGDLEKVQRALGEQPAKEAVILTEPATIHGFTGPAINPPEEDPNGA